jgi:hypothetical protein
MKTLENQLCPLPVDTSAFAGVLIATGRGLLLSSHINTRRR